MAVISAQRVRALLVGLLLTMPRSPAAAQGSPAPAVAIDPSPSCRACTIRLDPVTEVGGTADFGFSGLHLTLATDRLGRFYATGVGAQGTVTVFDSRGRVLRLLGRPGEGPGEFREPTRVLLGPGDSLLVYDAALRRVSVFAPDLTFARSFPAGLGPWRLVLLSDGTLLANGRMASAERIGFLYHQIGRSGNHLRSAGELRGMIGFQSGVAELRELTPASRGGFWAGTVNRYSFEYWPSLTATPTHYTAEAPWFPQWERSEGPITLVRPNPALAGLHEDEVGLLWVVVAVPSRTWKPIEQRGQSGERGAPVPSLHDFARSYETMVEVIDTRARRVVARQHVSMALFPSPDHPYVFTVHERPDGTEFMRVYRLSLFGRQ